MVQRLFADVINDAIWFMNIHEQNHPWFLAMMCLSTPKHNGKSGTDLALNNNNPSLTVVFTDILRCSESVIFFVVLFLSVYLLFQEFYVYQK
jgi:hypothetical protein